MNRMQKAAWVGFLWSLLFSIHFATASIAIFLFPAYRRILFLILFPILVFLIAALVWSRRKQSPADPECDERDSQISRRAGMAALISLSFLIYVSDALMLIWTGTAGNILTALLPVIHFWIGLLTLSFYYAAMLVLYGKGRTVNG